jgi:hypothetical protein
LQKKGLATMETSFSQEQRTKLRERIEFPLKIVALKDGRFESEEYCGKAVDVSEDGICLQTAQSEPIQDDVMCIVNMGEKEDPECLIGRVVWSSKGENANRYGLQLRQKRSGSYEAFLNKLRIRSNGFKKPTPKEGQFIPDEAILKVARYLDTSSIELNQIQMLDSNYVHKINQEQVWISNIRNVDEYAYEVNELRPYTVFCSYAYPNLKCPVCFDHTLDHYPMMSLFEMTRQMGLAIMHQFYHVPMKGYISIVQKLAFDYRVFAELDLPLTVFLVDTCEPQFVNKVQDRVVELFFVQENVICAYVLGEMSSIRAETYSRIRKSARRSKLIRRYGNIDEVNFVTNVDAAPLFSSRNNSLCK